MRRRFLFAHHSHVIAVAIALTFSGIIGWGCRNDSPLTSGDFSSLTKQTLTSDAIGLRSGFQVNLVANAASFSAQRIDAGLLNAWGIAFNPNGRVWISSNHAGAAVIYDENGNAVRSPVTIPMPDGSTGGSPTGMIFNPGSGFIIAATGEAAKFIFSTEDGTIAAWSSGSSANIVADRSSFNAVYKGLAMARVDGRSFIYATNFRGGTVDVFDNHFRYDSTKIFQDPSVPAGFAPFNIQNIGGDLFVTYAKQKGPDNIDDQPGPGNGFVDIFSADGSLRQRFASEGNLNSPWGIAAVPGNGAGIYEHAILVGNFGDGLINVFSHNGRFIGSLSDSSGTPIAIDGLWGLAFSSALMREPQEGEDHDNDTGEHHDRDTSEHHGDDHGTVSGDDDQHHDHGDGMNNMLPRLFFTAGPNGEEDGLFGYLKIRK